MDRERSSPYPYEDSEDSKPNPMTWNYLDIELDELLSLSRFPEMDLQKPTGDTLGLHLTLAIARALVNIGRELGAARAITEAQIRDDKFKHLGKKR